MTYREIQMANDDIHCHNKEKADVRFQDGGLRHAAGACCYQVVRAAKNKELSPEGRGFTYNHAPMVAGSHGKFVYEYLGGPSSEHEPPSAAFLCFSEDGIHWENPIEVFPSIDISSEPYRGPKREYIHTARIPCIVHHRMGFYTASSGRFLVMTFYGLSPDCHTAPNNGYGVGRAVREVYSDFSLSPIYWLRYNEPGGYNKENTDVFPFYKESEDEGFRQACRELLENRLVTQQWWEEERLDTAFFSRPDGRALSYYTLPDGRIMGVFKDSMTSISEDGGQNWTPIKKSVSIETASGKVWGQKTADGKYALVYNPTADSAHRWPLAVQTGDNGVDFDNLAAIVPETEPCRYEGRLKNLGPQYVRGITEANQSPDDMAMWVAYSVNKEDMWIARVPVPIKSVWNQDVHDRMEEMTEEKLRNTWNLYVPSWNQAQLSKTSDGCCGLCLRDCDPYNRTRAMRLFRPGSLVEIKAKLKVGQVKSSGIAIFLQDRHGQNITSAVIRPDGWVYMRNAGLDNKLCRYERNEDLHIGIKADAVENRVTVTASCAGEEGSKSGYAAASVYQLERILFTTKYSLPFQGLEANGRNGDIGNLPDADTKTEETVFWIVDLETETVYE